MKCEIPCRVKRIKVACCGMQIGQTYEALRDESSTYVSVKVGECDWSCDHWIGDFFEVLEGPAPKSGEANE